METDKTETPPELREKTDESLKEEREKTDGLIILKSKEAAEEALGEIRETRIAADIDREMVRAETATDEMEHRHADTTDQPVQSNDERLILERERSDKVLSAEREAQDRALEKERAQSRLAAESVLERERQETDRNLLDERARLDAEAARKTALLAHEKVSHRRTKTALLTRDRYIGILSHDLQNPLASISIATRLMRKHLSKGAVDTGTLLGNVGIIEQGVVFMNRMISDLLDVERMTNDKLVVTPVRVELSALLQECRDFFVPMVSSKALALTITCPERMFVDVDHDRILQVLSNLIGNAMKFSPQGTTIELSARKQATEAEISVRDEGPGIPKDKQQQIFKKFSQLNTNDRHGLGLGLFIARSIVEAHNGQIWVTSDFGKGSTFYFTLPLTPSHAISRSPSCSS